MYQRWFQQHIFTQSSMMLLSSSLMRELITSGAMSCEFGELMKFLIRCLSFTQYSNSFRAHLDENLCDNPFWNALAASGKCPNRRAQSPNSSHSNVNLLWLLFWTSIYSCSVCHKVYIFKSSYKSMKRLSNHLSQSLLARSGTSSCFSTPLGNEDDEVWYSSSITKMLDLYFNRFSQPVICTISVNSLYASWKVDFKFDAAKLTNIGSADWCSFWTSCGFNEVTSSSTTSMGSGKCRLLLEGNGTTLFRIYFSFSGDMGHEFNISNAFSISFNLRYALDKIYHGLNSLGEQLAASCAMFWATA